MADLKNPAPATAQSRTSALILLHWACRMISLIFTSMACLSPLAQAADKPQAAPTVVDVGVFLNNIRAINLKERKFQADFNLWFRWQGDAVNALDGFEVVDGQIDLKEELVKKKVGDTHYGLYRIVATIHNNFDLSKYPLDDHALQIQIEDVKHDLSELVYRPDTNHINRSAQVHVPGWNTGQFTAAVSVEKYPTRYGDTTLSTASPTTAAAVSSYSRFSFVQEIRRNGYGNFFKLFSMLFLAGILSFFAFRVRADYLDSRLALIVSGIFMAAITSSIIANSLPESDSFDMAEQLYLATMGFIFTTCLASLYTFKLHMADLQDKASLLSRRLGLVLPVLYVIVLALIVHLAHSEI